MIDGLHETLAHAQARTETRFTETVVGGEFRKSTADSGAVVRTLVTKRYEGPAQIKYTSMVVTDSLTSEQTVALQQLVAKLPMSAPRLFNGDEIVVTASTVDEHLVERVYRVEGSPQSGQTTARRYPVSELT